MNKNQLYKALLRAKNNYSNLDRYKHHLDNTKTIKVSFNHINNLDEMARQFTDIIKTDTIELPFESVFFDIRDYEITSLLDGELSKHNIGLHIQPAAMLFNDVQVVTMLIQDFRLYNKDVLSRTYMAYADLSGLHMMSSVDEEGATFGCNCYKNNIFSSSPQYVASIRDLMPCSVSELGLTLPNCSGQHAGCAHVLAHRNEITKLVKIILSYLTMPTNFLMKVSDIKKKSPDYYIITDSDQLESIKNGGNELYGNKFADGSNLKRMLKHPQFVPVEESFVVKQKLYTPFRSHHDTNGPGHSGA